MDVELDLYLINEKDPAMERLGKSIHNIFSI